MTNAALFRCQYPYGKSQLWLPMDLHKVAARLEAAEISADVIDLNLEQMPENIDSYDRIGIGVVGAPYVPVSRQVAKEVEKRTGKKPIIGGPGVEHLAPDEFTAIYGDAVQVTDDSTFGSAFGIDTIPPVYDTTISWRIQAMDRKELKRYLESEFSFFVSQGCRHACNFCAAVRSRKGAKVTEQFSHVVGEDLSALCEAAQSLDVRRLTMYLTSLDLFQNPGRFREVLREFSRAKQKYDTDFHLRGLSRIDSFLEAVKEKPEFYDLIPRSGLKTIGFGVDGTTEKVWRSQHKGNKSLSDADKAFELCKKLGVTPEALMVMGFHDQAGNPVDTPYSLNKNVDYSLDRAERYGAVIRPHVAKDMVPGNDGWHNPAWSVQHDRLLKYPQLFRNLDFVALASDITHPDPEFRQYVNRAYIEIVRRLAPHNLCATSPLLPYTGDRYADMQADMFNMLVPFDR